VSTIPAQDANLILAAVMVIFALMGWIALWSRRSPAVHWWWTAQLVGALSVATFAKAHTLYAALPASVTYPLIATLGVAGVVLKGLSLHRLSYDTGGRWLVTVVILVNLAIAGGLALQDVGTVPFSIYLACAILACACVTLLLIVQVSRRELLRSARLLAVATAIPWLATLLLLLFLAPTGKDVLAVSSEPVRLTYLLPGIVGVAANSLLFIGMVLELAERRQADTDAALTRERIGRLRLEERARLVADLHDGFGSQLTSARLRAERRELSASELCTILDQCLADLHLVVDTVDNLEGDVGDSLRYLRHRLASRLGDVPVAIRWTLHTDGVPALTSDQLLQVLRVVQEAISNALRHSGCREIHVTAEFDPAGHVLRCSVRDDGSGFVLGASEGAGLRNMRGRAERLGANLALNPTPQGTTVTLALPLPTPVR
jgi:signal transduction histidine kinase